MGQLTKDWAGFLASLEWEATVGQSILTLFRFHSRLTRRQVEVCRDIAIIDSYLGSIVDTKVGCRRHDRTSVPVCISPPALVQVSS